MPLTIAVDFDGTVVHHRYPDVGEAVPFAEEALRYLTSKGHRLILWTMRSGASLRDAEEWFALRGIMLFGVNRNPAQSEWTKSPKAYAELYIDDAALGCPLSNPSVPGRPYVDWRRVMEILEPDWRPAIGDSR